MFWKNRIFRYALRVSIIFRLAIKSDIFQMARVKFILKTCNVICKLQYGILFFCTSFLYI